LKFDVGGASQIFKPQTSNLISKWQLHVKNGSFTGFRFKPDLTMRLLNNSFAHCKTQTGAG